MVRFAGSFVVLVRADKNRFRKFTAIVAHEITHVVQYLLRDRRIPLTEETEEVYAYLTESLLYQALCEAYE